MTNQVHFLLVKNMVKKQTIYCPKCNRKVGTYDGKGKIDKVCRCKKCNKKIIFKVATGETVRKSLPIRNCSSGMTFLI
nr:MAG TPA: DNA-directed RNA polymerase [Caudoviricetes sp.]